VAGCCKHGNKPLGFFRLSEEISVSEDGLSSTDAVSHLVSDALFAPLQFVGHHVAILFAERFTYKIIVSFSGIMFIPNFVTIRQLVQKFKGIYTPQTAWRFHKRFLY
jgi:hypothetical protein